MDREDGAQEEFSTGKAAYYSGEDNPYPDGTAAASNWFRGYNYAKKFELEKVQAMHMSKVILMSYLQMDLGRLMTSDLSWPWRVNSFGAFERHFDAAASTSIQIWVGDMKQCDGVHPLHGKAHAIRSFHQRFDVVHGRINVKRLRFDEYTFASDDAKLWLRVVDNENAVWQTMQPERSGDFCFYERYQWFGTSQGLPYQVQADTNFAVTISRNSAPDLSKAMPVNGVYIPSIMAEEYRPDAQFETLNSYNANRDFMVSLLTDVISGME
jgi:hypothetical protein